MRRRLAILFLLLLAVLATPALALDGDLDGDTDVDVDDIDIILDGAGPTGSSPADPGDPRDLDADGFITSTLDARIAAACCTRALCAVGNNAPTITDIADQTIDEDTATGPLAFTVGDPDGTSPKSLIVTAVSSDQTLIPDSNLTLGGTGADRTLDVLPAADQNGGPATVTVTVDDGDATAETTFEVTVEPVDDPPVAEDDAATVAEDDPATEVDVQANDGDVDGGPISVDSVTQPANGTVAVTGGGTALTYEPDADYCNDGSPTDDFTYTLSPGGSTATVAMTVTCVEDPGIDIEKATNGHDADTAPGPTLTEGDAVTWTYVVTNTSDVALSSVTVSDDQGVAVSCPAATLSSGASMTCTGNGTAVVGQYANLGTATGSSPGGTMVSDTDPSHYFGEILEMPDIDIEKATNGHDADSAPGPTLTEGDSVTWTYLVTNTGNVELSSMTVSDDQGVAVSCPAATLSSGASMTCTGNGTAVVGQYANLGTATGNSPGGTMVSDTDPSHYFGDAMEMPDISIQKATNGHDADVAPGPFLIEGDSVTWTYIVTNTGDVTLSSVTVSDDQGVSVSCPTTTLSSGASMTCTGSGTAAVGQYANLGTVTGNSPGGTMVSDTDPSHYFGDAMEMPDISLSKATNGHDADFPPGPFLIEGDSVTWTYVVINTGDVTLSSVTVSDDQGVSVSCPTSTLSSGASMTCTGSGTAVVGQYSNLGTATGNSPGGTMVSDTDPSHYFGDAMEMPDISIEKATNGHDADFPPGPAVLPGDSVTWTYVVTNTGDVTLSSITVSDDQGVSVSCPTSTLSSGASMTCTGSGTAITGQYSNVGTATGTSPGGTMVSDTDPSHYNGQPM